MELSIQTERAGLQCEMTLAGEIDVYTSPNLKRELVTQSELGCINIIVNLDGVTFLDSSGLGVLVGALRRAREHGGTVRIVCKRVDILKVFRITGLDKAFPIFSEMTEARRF